uniref:Uncharacterized protein n=1 Tax=Kalanchoe fedtschenkoi TaxID=63787 RepID=A0A7N0T640_KALFE
MRIGSFQFDSQVALLKGKYFAPLKISQEENVEIQWFYCTEKCQNWSLDCWHMELFLSEGFLNGNWKYKHIGARDVPKNTIGASVAIFDIKHLNDRSTSGFQVKYHVMKAGNDGEVVSIRVSLPV